jgi:hypothetical protein
LHSLARTHASFDCSNLVSHVGLVPVMALAQRAGLGDLVAGHARPGGECGVNADLKIACLVAGMAVGADTGTRSRAPGSGTPRSREVAAGARAERAGRAGQHADRGAGDRRGPSARRQRRLRAGRGRVRRAGHAHGAGLRVYRCDRGTAGLGVLRGRGDRCDPPQRGVLLRHRPDGRPGRRRDRRHLRRRLDPISYPRAIWDEQLRCWISDAEAAETDYTAFASKKGQAVTARLVVRRVRDLNKHAGRGMEELFPVWRYHAVFTDSPFDLVQAEGQHRDHAVVEQTFADVTTGPLAQLPSGVFAANAAGLSIAAMAHNLVRAAGALASLPFAKARAATRFWSPG